MGSTSWDIPFGSTAKQEALDDVRRNLSSGLDIVDYCYGPGEGRNAFRYGGWGSTLYLAVRDSDGAVSMHVRLFSSYRDGGVRCISAKDVHEDMGLGGCHEVAARVMARLTPTDNEYANEWRAAVEKRRQVRRDNRRKAKAAVGRRITLGSVVTFQRLGEITVVDVESDAVWRDPVSGWVLRAPSKWWERVPFTIDE